MHPEQVEIRPRTTGEILDDGWRLYFEDAPLFLVLSGLFTIPGAVGLLLLLTLPRPQDLSTRSLLPAVTALLVPLTGLGSGACQLALRHKAEGKPVSAWICLTVILRHGLMHVAGQGIYLLAWMFLGIVPVLVVWLTFGETAATLFLGLGAVTIWTGRMSLHPVLAAREAGLFSAFQKALRETQRQPIKTLLIFGTFPIVVLFGFFNLHSLVRVSFWIGENLGGFDLAFPAVSLSLSNPVYDVIILLLTVVLIGPYVEAVHYLFHVDGQTRFEGLDLWYRVQRHFPTRHQTRVGLVLLVTGAALFLTGRCQAEDTLSVVREARHEIATIRNEAASAKPYPGGSRWTDQLDDIAESLDPDGTTSQGKYRWFRKSIEKFASRNQADALNILGDLDHQLALVEKSLATHTPSTQKEQEGKLLTTEELKKLLPQEPREKTSPKKDHSPQPKEAEVKRPVARNDQPKEQSGSGNGMHGPGAVGPGETLSLGSNAWMVLSGLSAIVLLIGLVLLVVNRKRDPKPKKAPKVVPADPTMESILTQPDQHTVASLWNQADQMARTGNWIEAVRLLYMGVLALLHRGNFIRFERTRTNGEYVHQLHSRTELQNQFRRMTGFFESAWFGGGLCNAADFRSCKEMAETIRHTVQESNG